MLAFCLRKINGLKRGSLKFIDASFIWTEPHSRRIKVSIIVERSVLDDRMNVRQKAVIEFVVKMKQCIGCIRESTDHNWGAAIQIRQRTYNKKTLSHLEMMLTKAGLQDLMIGVNVIRDGLDLYCRSKNHAEKITNFIMSNFPAQKSTSKKLVSQNKKASTQNIEYTIVIEVAALTKGDLIFTSIAGKKSLDFFLVTKVTS